MLLYNKETEFHSRIIVNKITESAAFYLSNLQLTEFDKTELSKYVVEKRKLQWYASRYTIRLLLNQDEIIHLNKDEFGRPFILNHDIHISLSHTNSMVVAISNNMYKVGVDLEQIRDKVKRIAHKFTTEKECKYITIENENATLITIWSAKESIYKMYSQKQLDFKEHILLEPFEYKGSGSFKAWLSKENLHKELTVHYVTLDDHVLTYVEDL
jgi:4'-phosphopantetheinyl transferase